MSYSVSTLTPSQRRLKAEQERAVAGGFQESADYWRSILNDENNPTYAQMNAPEERKFREQTIPDIAEQYAGMGAGGLSSSGFRNSAVSAGVDLSERLAGMRANLRTQAAQSLNAMGENALNPVKENIIENQESGPGGGQYLAGAAAGAITGGLAGAPAGGVGAVPGAVLGGIAGLAGVHSQKKNAFGLPPISKQTDPYGGNSRFNNSAKPNMGSPYGGPPSPPQGGYNPNYQLPTYLNR